MGRTMRGTAEELTVDAWLVDTLLPKPVPSNTNILCCMWGADTRKENHVNMNYAVGGGLLHLEQQICWEVVVIRWLQKEHNTLKLQGDQKVSVHLMITIQKVTSNVQRVESDCLAADLQCQGETRLTLTPSVIPNSNYVIIAASVV
jgi:hypothetical protein